MPENIHNNYTVAMDKATAILLQLQRLHLIDNMTSAAGLPIFPSNGTPPLHSISQSSSFSGSPASVVPNNPDIILYNFQQQGLRNLRQSQSCQSKKQIDDAKIRRTIYVTGLRQEVTEGQLIAFFSDCGVVCECRICGDPSSALRFGFVEFLSEIAAATAILKAGQLLAASPIRVAPSKTAIVPVGNRFLPKSEFEIDAVARTVYVANIDRAIERDALCQFFSTLCGPVGKVRVLGNSHQISKIAFVEFTSIEAAKMALRYSGAKLGTLPLRISPSKTPVKMNGRRKPSPLATTDGAALGQCLSI
jgi:RNA recognition motif-containing protein